MVPSVKMVFPFEEVFTAPYLFQVICVCMSAYSDVRTPRLLCDSLGAEEQIVVRFCPAQQQLPLQSSCIRKMICMLKGVRKTRIPYLLFDNTDEVLAKYI